VIGITPFAAPSRIIVTAVLSPNRVVIADYEKRELLRVISLEETCGRALSLSADGRYMATGHWEVTPVSIWDLTTGSLVAKFGPSKVGRLLLSSKGDYVLVRSKKGSGIFDTSTHLELPVVRCGDPWSSCVIPLDNSMLVALDRKGKILLARSEPLRLEEIDIGMRGTIWLMRWSALDGSLLLMDSTGEVVCRNGLIGDARWRLRLRPDNKSCAGSFCGDGTLVAIGSGDLQTIAVYDANTGQFTRQIDVNAGAFWPFGDRKVMSASGIVIDLASGEVAEGVSDWRWWRSIGASV
jgi:WD40 repeat protein